MAGPKVDYSSYLGNYGGYNTWQNNQNNQNNYVMLNNNNNSNTASNPESDTGGYAGTSQNGKGGRGTTNKKSSNTGGNSGSGGGNTVYTPGPEINFNSHTDANGNQVGITLDNENDIEKTLIDYLYRPGGQSIDSDINEELSFQLPDYGYDRHLLDIRNWQKQLVSFGAEPGWFFFKIFFNFHTNYGLLGGMLKMVKSKKQIEQEEQTSTPELKIEIVNNEDLEAVMYSGDNENE